MAGATLEPFVGQGPKKELFLEIFNKLIEDRLLVVAFRRHFALVKATIPPPLAL